MLAPEIDILDLGIALDFFRRPLLEDTPVVHDGDAPDDAQHDIFAQTGYLLLEEALGEYDMETRVGAIGFGGVKSEHGIVIR